MIASCAVGQLLHGTGRGVRESGTGENSCLVNPHEIVLAAQRLISLVRDNEINPKE
jgi:hypothetical protein